MYINIYIPIYPHCISPGDQFPRALGSEDKICAGEAKFHFASSEEWDFYR